MFQFPLGRHVAVMLSGVNPGRQLTVCTDPTIVLASAGQGSALPVKLGNTPQATGCTIIKAKFLLSTIPD